MMETEKWHNHIYFLVTVKQLTPDGCEIQRKVCVLRNDDYTKKCC